ncbi:MAG: hypothetical protein PF636_11660 [Actinomycetota bacterium]|jgi:hypothetical protein|nr:hypothetical protein [Actinomycetota bacterium]
MNRSYSIRLLLVAVLLVTMTAVAPALAIDASYTHVWHVESLMTGEVGETRKTVALSDIELVVIDGSYLGSIAYQDILAVQDLDGVTTSQISEVLLDLSGTALDGGESAGGTFTGTVKLILRPATDLDTGASPEVLALSSGTAEIYDVRGHWGARLINGVAQGEVLFELVELRDSDNTRDAAWFNRSSLADPDGLGLGQTFVVEVGGLSDPDALADENGADGDDAEAAGGGTASVWKYISCGLTGDIGENAVPASGASALAARSLRDARPARATVLPDSAVSIDIDMGGAYLDAKNRAAGLVSSSGPRVDGASRATASFTLARDAVPGRAAIPDDADAGLEYVSRIRDLLVSVPGAQGTADVAGEMSLIRPGADSSSVMRLRTLAIVVESVGADSYGDVLRPTYDAAREVASRVVPSSGAVANSVLAAADSPMTPRSTLSVGTFDRLEDLDVVSGPDGERLPNRVLARHGSGSGGIRSGLAWQVESGSERVAPTKWMGYRRADGAVFWRAGESGNVALTDASLLGWGWSVHRGALVDTDRCGRVLALFVTE